MVASATLGFASSNEELFLDTHEGVPMNMLSITPLKDGSSMIILNDTARMTLVTLESLNPSWNAEQLLSVESPYCIPHYITIKNQNLDDQITVRRLGGSNGDIGDI